MVDVVSYPKSRLNDTSTEVWDIIQKMPPIKDEGNLMSNVYIVTTTLVGWERLQSGGCEGTISEAIFKRICLFLISIKRYTRLKNQISFVFSLA